MRLAISTTETLTDLKTDLVVANNNNNNSVTSCRIPAIWKSSTVIPIPKPDKESSLGTSYRSISLLCPVAKGMEALMLTSINNLLLTAADQHGFRPGHSTTSARQQLTSDVATGFNQRKPPHRTICVAADLTVAFHTVNQNVLPSKIARSTFPEAPVDGCKTTSEAGNQLQTAEA